MRDVVLSPNGKTAYVSTADGKVTGYDLETGDVTVSWAVGVNLGGMDVSPDGRFLLAAEMDTTGQNTNGVYTGSLTVHRVDLITGVVQDFKTPSPGAAPAYDVAFLSNGKALITQGYSTNGQSYLTSLDWHSGAYEQSKTSYLWGSTIVSSEDYSTSVVNPEMSSLGGYLFVYKSGIQSTLNWYGGNGDDVGGNIALSFNGKMGVLNTHLYTSSLDERQYFQVGGDQGLIPGGAAFATDGKSFFFLDHATNTIFEFSTASLIVQRAFSSASGIAPGGGAFGDALSVSSDGRYLVVMGQTLQVIDLEKVVADGGTGYADSLVGGGGDDVLQGYMGADLLEGGAGADTLRGGYDEDTLIGGAGNDYLHGGDAIDTADYSDATAAIVVDTPAYGTRTARGEGVDTLVSIENIKGGRFADLIVGTSGANRLEGGDGADTLRGGAGADTLQGGGGDDELGGDAGDDILDGGPGSRDLVSYESAEAAVTVDLSLATAQNTLGAGSDTLASIEGLKGSQFADTLKGNIQANSLSGGNGADFIDGGDGNDTLLGEAGDDIAWGGLGQDYVTGGDGFDQINGNVGNDTAYGGEGGDWVVGGKDNDLLYGENGADVVNGNLGNDTCYGGADADWVRGGQGDDVLDGGAGNDWMSGDRGNDSVTGGAGADTFYFFAGAAMDRVTDFSAAAGDRVLLDAGQTYTLSYTAEGAVISLGVGDQMILVGVTEATLGAWLFV